MCGVEKEENIIGKKCHDIFPGETCHTEHCPLKLVLKGEKKVDEDVRKELPDGEERFYILNARPYYSEDREVIGVMEIFKDVTVRREIQAMAEHSAQQQGRMEMANNVLHDIGNALTGISVHALKPQNQKEWEEIKSIRQLRDLFAKKSPELISAFGREKSEELIKFMDALLVTLEKRCDSSIEFSRKISKAVGHMTSVLDLQRLYMKENSAPLATDIALGNMIEDALLMLAAGAEKREIEVKTSFDGQNPRVAGDQTRLIRVFLNIIKNAYEAFDADNSDDPKILTANVYVDNENDQAVIVFADNASGFHSESAESFFERGFSTKERGLGIGLQECRSIIESHSGTVAIESEGEGKGAKVIIKLPLLKARKG
jgi:PAS domain S-box-containing protein